MIGIIIAFIITIKSGQYDDLDSPAFRILMDDDDPRIPGNPADTSLVNENKEEKAQ